jgi:multicomponent Na+:H+ antiporter subunit E
MVQAMRPVLLVFALAFLWWLLSNGDLSSWIVGAPVVLAAAWAGQRINPNHGVGMSLAGVLKFLPFFLSESLRGGIDVARRVLSPRLDVAPGFLTYRTRLSGPQARLLFVNSVSLLPGTLAADLQDDRLTIHALDSDAEFAEDLARLETAVARVYREAL